MINIAMPHHPNVSTKETKKTKHFSKTWRLRLVSWMWKVRTKTVSMVFAALG
jgi:hypothetical protein